MAQTKHQHGPGAGVSQGTPLGLYLPEYCGRTGRTGHPQQKAHKAQTVYGAPGQEKDQPQDRGYGAT